MAMAMTMIHYLYQILLNTHVAGTAPSYLSPPISFTITFTITMVSLPNLYKWVMEHLGK